MDKEIGNKTLGIYIGSYCKNKYDASSIMLEHGEGATLIECVKNPKVYGLLDAKAELPLSIREYNFKVRELPYKAQKFSMYIRYLLQSEFSGSENIYSYIPDLIRQFYQFMYQINRSSLHDKMSDDSKFILREAEMAVVNESYRAYEEIFNSQLFISRNIPSIANEVIAIRYIILVYNLLDNLQDSDENIGDKIETFDDLIYRIS